MSGEVVVCDYPSKATRLAHWRVVFRGGHFYLQWIRGFAYKTRVTNQHTISVSTARAHWSHAHKEGCQAIHWQRFNKLIMEEGAHAH